MYTCMYNVDLDCYLLGISHMCLRDLYRFATRFMYVFLMGVSPYDVFVKWMCTSCSGLNSLGRLVGSLSITQSSFLIRPKKREIRNFQ